MKNKLHILKNKPSISEQEISEMMDFEQLLLKNQRKQPNFPRGYYALFRWGFGVLLVAAGVYWVQHTFSEEQVEAANNKARISKSLVTPNEHATLNTDSYAREELVLSPDNIGTEDEFSIKPKVVSTELRKNQKPVKKSALNGNQQKPVAQSPAPISQEQYTFTEAKPKIGLKEMYAYLNSELVYPKEHLQEHIEGEVLVNFTVDKNGNIVKINIEKPLGEAFDQEAIRVIRSMPPWDPAMVNGTAIDSKLAIPLYFNIKE